jgi:hypothetical protein
MTFFYHYNGLSSVPMYDQRSCDFCSCTMSPLRSVVSIVGKRQVLCTITDASALLDASGFSFLVWYPSVFSKKLCITTSTQVRLDYRRKALPLAWSGTRWLHLIYVVSFPCPAIGFVLQVKIMQHFTLVFEVVDCRRKTTSFVRLVTRTLC